MFRIVVICIIIMFTRIVMIVLSRIIVIRSSLMSMRLIHIRCMSIIRMMCLGMVTIIMLMCMTSRISRYSPSGVLADSTEITVCLISLLGITMSRLCRRSLISLIVRGLISMVLLLVGIIMMLMFIIVVILIMVLIRLLRLLLGAPCSAAPPPSCIVTIIVIPIIIVVLLLTIMISFFLSSSQCLCQDMRARGIGRQAEGAMGIRPGWGPVPKSRPCRPRPRAHPMQHIAASSRSSGAACARARLRPPLIAPPTMAALHAQA